MKHYALEHAPAYQHPRQVVFLDQFPPAVTGKVDRKALAELARSHWQAAAVQTRRWWQRINAMTEPRLEPGSWQAWRSDATCKIGQN